ncbi:MAG: hypothetical protein ACAI38_06440 [Myxococcota bacterium]
MQFIVDTATQRHAYEERRVVFSWVSFYAGVGVAMGMMLIAFKALPTETRVLRAEAAPTVAASVAERLVGEVSAAPSIGSVTASSLVLAIEAASPSASVRGASVALEHLRWRGAALVGPLDREYAALAVMELMGKTRAQAEAVVDAWVR